MPLPTPKQIATTKIKSNSEAIEDLCLLPKHNWYAGLDASWYPGEEGAEHLLNKFLDKAIEHYNIERDRPDIEGTSRLSPHLHFGEISPRQLLWSLLNISQDIGGISQDRYRSQLGWRELAHYTLYHFPQTATQSMDSRFNQAAWVEGEQAEVFLERWRQGKTGIPIVDAGMRELWHTGWMHNRVRMVVASFLTKNLGIHWLRGAQWFWDTLIDADLANNSMGWQWCSGCGVDAAPYFRVFNPARQLQLFDPERRYIYKWLPEMNASSGIDKYMEPIVDLSETRITALQRWDRIKKHWLPKAI